MNPRYRTAIQYDPGHRGLQLAIAYVRLKANSPFRTHDLYGFMTGYCGGWAWDDHYFHVGEQSGAGFVSFTPSWSGTGWTDDRIGASGLANKDFNPGIERLLGAIENYLFRRWICWTGDGRPDLLPAAKRKLKCVDRSVSYSTPGFDWTLLDFLYPVSGISFSTIRPRRKR